MSIKTRKRLIKEFKKFDNDNPHIWKLFVKFTKISYKSGLKKIGISLITERIRWEVNINSNKYYDTFKINNNHRAFYARKFMKTYPKWKYI